MVREGMALSEVELADRTDDVREWPDGIMGSPQESHGMQGNPTDAYNGGNQLYGTEETNDRGSEVRTG